MSIFCKNCLYTANHPFGITFNNDGICSGCKIHKEKNIIDWDDRLTDLKKLVYPYKSKSKKTYDCIVPITGGGDSFYILHVVKNILGLNPLLVCYNRHHNSNIGIKNIARLRIAFDADLILQNVNPLSVKKIIRTTLREFGSVYWHSIAGHTAFPVQIAEKKQIPLIIWGAHQGIEQVGMYSHLHNVEMTRRYRKEHDLMGYEADDLVSQFDSLVEQDIWQFRYPEDNEIAKIGIRGIYLGNYIRWDPFIQHQYVVEQYGYRGIPSNRTFYPFDHPDCMVYMGVHDLLKMAKTGYSKVTDHLVREIRHERISRASAVIIASMFENNHIQNTEIFCKWMNLTEAGLKYIVRSHTKNFVNLTKMHDIKDLNFIREDLAIYNKGIDFNNICDQYITIAKGYP
jgi:N-acetyl sugar amidotransferase